MAATDATTFLKQTPLFANLSDDQIDAMAKTAKQRHFETDDAIVEEGQEGVGFYLILDGSVEVRKQGKRLATLQRGDYFGEMALLLEDAKRTADVVALEATTCLLITRWDLRSLIRNHPDVALAMHSELGRRLSQTNQALSE